MARGGRRRNGHQQIALERHCRFGFETIRPGLSYLVPGGSIVLSVNSGYE